MGKRAIQENVKVSGYCEELRNGYLYSVTEMTGVMFRGERVAKVNLSVHLNVFTVRGL